MADKLKDLPEEFQQPDVSLPFWMAGKQLSLLAATAKLWWSKLAGWINFPGTFLDPLTCPMVVLNLLAWERAITRYPAEPERLYRLRVKYAYANGKDAGSIAGWKRIFKRLELPPVELEERQHGADWDVIDIVLNDADMPDAQNVLEIIIDDYGRTCRRYRFVSRIEMPRSIGIVSFSADHNTVMAEPLAMETATKQLGIATFDLDHNTIIAGVF